MVVGVRGCGRCTVVVILANIILLFFLTQEITGGTAPFALYILPLSINMLTTPSYYLSKER